MLTRDGKDHQASCDRGTKNEDGESVDAGAWTTIAQRESHRSKTTAGIGVGGVTGPAVGFALFAPHEVMGGGPSKSSQRTSAVLRSSARRWPWDRILTVV